MNTPAVAKNDNSNPQQGTSSSASSLTNATTSPVPAVQEVANGGNAESLCKTEKFKIPPTQRDARKIFVGGLPPEVSGEEFRAFFEKFGTILDSVVMVDRETKRSRGFGFVLFEDVKVANRILSSTFTSSDSDNHDAKDEVATNKSPDPLESESSNSKSMKHGKVCIRGKWCEVKPSEPKKEGMNMNSTPSSFMSRKSPPRRGGPMSLSPSAVAGQNAQEHNTGLPVGADHSQNSVVPVPVPFYQQSQPQSYGGESYYYGYYNNYDMYHTHTFHQYVYPDGYGIPPFHYSNGYYQTPYYGTHQVYNGPQSAFPPHVQFIPTTPQHLHNKEMMPLPSQDYEHIPNHGHDNLAIEDLSHGQSQRNASLNR